jgi:putative ABC transport system substrate-binding protein
VLADANVAKPVHLAQLRQAAQSHGVEALVRGVAKRDDVISAINDVKASGAQAINFLATPVFSVNAAEFIRQVMTLRLPSIYQWPENAEDGALIGYGPRFTEIYRERARIAAKVLRGTKPADIPIEQPTRFELVINLKTAKAIGHEVPSGLLSRADKVIELRLSFAAVHESAFGTKQTSQCAQPMSAFGGKADIGLTPCRVCF